MPLGLFKGERTYLVEPREGVTHFAMTEAFSGPLRRRLHEGNSGHDRILQHLRGLPQSRGGGADTRVKGRCWI